MIVIGWSASGVTVIGWSVSRVTLIGWSVSFGALCTLGTGGAAGSFVVGVDAQPGLHHRHTVVASVPTVLICDERTAGDCIA